jgi:hypothetical protein
MDTTRLLPLDQERTIALTINKAVVAFTFAHVERSWWRHFCESLTTRVEQKAGARTSVLDEETALVELFGKAFRSATGYTGVDRATDAKQIPVRHRIAAASVLRAVSAELPAVDGVSLSEFTEIRLNAPWSVGPDGQMEMFTGLVHRFREPSIEQLRRFRMGCARVSVQGTAQDGVTVYPSRLAVALGLYDELIVETEGYSWMGAPLGENQARESMDGMHRARAVLELFERDSEEIAIGGKQDAAAA